MFSGFVLWFGWVCFALRLLMVCICFVISLLGGFVVLNVSDFGCLLWV